MLVCKCFARMSQMIVAVHHTYVLFCLNIGAKQLIFDVEDGDVELQSL